MIHAVVCYNLWGFYHIIGTGFEIYFYNELVQISIIYEVVAMELLSEEKHSSEHCDIVVVEDVR